MGLLLAVRCFIPARWALARWAEKAAPDPAGLDELVFALLIVLLPALLLTLLLRAIGVKGQ